MHLFQLEILLTLVWALLGVGHQRVQVTGWVGLTGGARRAVIGAPQLVLKVVVNGLVCAKLVHVQVNAVTTGGRVELEYALVCALSECGLHLGQRHDVRVAHVGHFHKNFSFSGAQHVGQVQDSLGHPVQGKVAHLLIKGGHLGCGGTPPAPPAHCDRLQHERLVWHFESLVFFRWRAFFVTCK